MMIKQFLNYSFKKFFEHHTENRIKVRRVTVEEIRTLSELAHHLGFSPQRLYYLAGNSHRLYIPIQIPKKGSAQQRDILIPTLELKGIQRAILQIILSQLDLDNCAYAYVKNKSAIAAARRIAGEKFVLKCDIANFFPSITSNRVCGLFKSIGFPAPTAHILTNLTTHQNCLPQGAPSSPTISNLICRSMDKELERLSDKFYLNYIRYSDDLIFFGEHPFNKDVFITVIEGILQKHTFNLNAGKTRFYSPKMSKFILGVNVSGANIKLPRKILRSYRAAFFQASKDLNLTEEKLSQLTGMAEYYKCVYGKDERYFDFKRIIENTRKVKLHQTYIV